MVNLFHRGLIGKLLTSLLHDREDPRFAVISSVSADSQAHFIRM